MSKNPALPHNMKRTCPINHMSGIFPILINGTDSSVFPENLPISGRNSISLFSDLICFQIFINNIVMFPDGFHSLLYIILDQAVIYSPVAVQQPVPVFLGNMLRIITDH